MPAWDVLVSLSRVQRWQRSSLPGCHCRTPPLASSNTPWAHGGVCVCMVAAGRAGTALAPPPGRSAKYYPQNCSTPGKDRPLRPPWYATDIPHIIVQLLQLLTTRAARKLCINHTQCKIAAGGIGGIVTYSRGNLCL